MVHLSGMTESTTSGQGATNLFPNLIFVPQGIDKSHHLVARGREIVAHQAEFWKRYAQIEEVYAQSLQSLLGHPCATWETSHGIFAKKRKIQEHCAPLQQGWTAVLNSVQQISERHGLISAALLQQGHAPLDAYLQQTEDDIARVSEQIQTLPTEMEHSYKGLQKSRQNYIKIAQTQKGKHPKFFHSLLEISRNSYENRCEQNIG